MNEKQLKQIFPQCRYPADWVRPLNDAMKKYGIDQDVRRTAAFLGQIGVESGQLNRLEENLSYSPQRIVEVWPKRFKSIKEAMPYSRNPERLGSKVYALRLGNGEERTGDGFRYRGRGLIQVTGKDNYKEVGELIGLPGLVQMPDYLLHHRYAAQSAAAYWVHVGLNEMADTIGDKPLEDVVKKVTKSVQGGVLGLEDRIAFTRAALAVLDTEFSV